MLTPVIVPLTPKLVSVPTDVTLGCEAVVREPANVVATTPVAPKLPTLLLPVPLKLPTCKVAVTLPNVPLPVADTMPPVTKLPAVTLPVAVINPAVPKLPTLAFPDTETAVNVPTLVILGCAFVVTVPAVVALVAAPLNAPTNVVAYNAPLLVLATKTELAVSVTFPVSAFANIRYALPADCVVTLM